MLPASGPHSSGLGLGHQPNKWDKTLSPAISASSLLLRTFPARMKPSTHERRAPSLRAEAGLPKTPLKINSKFSPSGIIPGKSHHTGVARRRASPGMETRC